MANERTDLDSVTNEDLIAFIVRRYGSNLPPAVQSIVRNVRDFERDRLHLQDDTTRQDSLQFIDFLTHLIGD